MIQMILDRIALLQKAQRQISFQSIPSGGYILGYTQVYEALGMTPAEKKSRRLPREEKRITLDGVEWHLHAAKESVPYVDRWTGQKRIAKAATHRLFVRCPICEKEIPAGRLHQHAMVHKDLLKTP